MKITFINVGYGEAILLECENPGEPDCYRVMVDGGGSEPEEYDQFPLRIRAADYLEKHNIHHINLLISTHIHEDHVCGLLPIVQNIKIDELWCNYALPAEFQNLRIDTDIAQTASQKKFISAINTYSQIYRFLSEHKAKIHHISGISTNIQLKNGLYVDVLGPSVETSAQLSYKMKQVYQTIGQPDNINHITSLDEWMNKSSIMLCFHWNGKTIFLPSDVDCNGFDHLSNHMDLLSADICKIAHHGQIDAINPTLAKAISPQVVVTCASSDRRYNSSNPQSYLCFAHNTTNAQKPISFFFTDNVMLPPYSADSPMHSSVVVDISDSDGEVSAYYE